ncbi:MAG TPA: hypothetical protein VKQ06_11325, partial [Gammaproteobacteria bacterium]|nr:hypothetical protein [Gammaproteobacteria bacterium]
LTDEADVADITIVGPDTITRSDGTPWALQGFRAGMLVKVTGSAKNATNDHAYRIEAVNGAVLVMDERVTLTQEADVGATLEGIYKVSVLAAADEARALVTDTSTNTNILDLANDVNSALEDAGLGQLMQASADGARLVLTASAGVSGRPEFVFRDNAGEADERDTITRDSGSWLDDGFRPGFAISVTGTKRFFGLGEDNDGVYTVAEISADGKVLRLVAEEALVDSQGRILSAFNDVGITQTFAFSVTPDAVAAAELGLGTADEPRHADRADLLIHTATAAEPFRITLDGVETLEDLLARIEIQTNGTVNAQINADENGIDLIQVPTLIGDVPLTFARNSDGSESLTRASGSWADDGFASGDEIRILGSSANDGTWGILSISADGRVLTLETGSLALTPEGPSKDIAVTIAGNELLRVASTNGSPSANRLGLLRADAEIDQNADGVVDVRDGDGRIEGQKIAGISLLDRFFLTGTSLTGTVSIETPGTDGDVATPDGIEIVGDFGFAELGLTGNGNVAGVLTVSLEDPNTQTGTAGRITITEVIDAVKNGISGIDSIVDVSVGGPRVSGTMQFDVNAGADDTITLTGSETWGDQYQPLDLIEVRGSSQNDGYYRIKAIDAARKVLTLDDDLPAFEIATSPVTVAGGIGTLSLDAEFSIEGLFENLSLGDKPQLIIDLFDFGDPFHSERFTQITGIV